ncbi:MAG: AmmeMemoRadiSam system protein B [Planctomycetota bacterium]|jgi:AmmeMemoRadiSam system protein B
MSVRPPAVAGRFYPVDPVELEEMVERYLADARPSGPAPLALITPHAGYIYSGPVAATGYATVRGPIERVILLGPAHRYPLRGLAGHSAEAFLTPLGPIQVDTPELPHTKTLDAAHAGEHSLEVHLPFLQVVLGDFTLTPLVVGDATPGQVTDVLEQLWGGPETLVVISSDLSHFHDYDTAVSLDRATATAIEELRHEAVGPHEACGCRAIGGLLRLAQDKGLKVTTLDLRNSGDTAGPRNEVVGYGSFAFTSA